MPTSVMPVPNGSTAAESLLAQVESLPAPRGLSALLAAAVGGGDGTDLRRRLCASARAAFVTSLHAAPIGFDPDELWLHSVAVGCAAEGLAAATGRVDRLRAFAAGLLHDAGKFVLAANWPRSFERAVRRAPSAADFCAVESDVLGVDHTLAGRRLARRWGWPRPVGDAIWFHHHAPLLVPARIADRELVLIVQLADALARRENIGWSGNFAPPTEWSSLADALGLTAAAIEDIASGLRAACGALAEPSATAEAGTDARTLRTLAAFAAEALAAIDLPTVCRQAASALLAVLRADTALLLVACPDAERLTAAWARGATTDSEIVSGGDAAVVRHELERAALSGSPVVPVTTALSRFADCFSARLGGELGWLMPMLPGTGFPAGVLLSGAEGAIDETRDATGLAAAWRAIVGLAVARAAEREELTRLSESLATAARSAGESLAAADAARQLRMVEELAAGAAHELNTPLAVIGGRAQQLLLRETDHDARVMLEQIREQTERCSDIVTALAGVADQAVPQREPVDVGRAMRSLAQAWESSGKIAAGQIRLELSDSVRPVLVDPGHLREMLSELLANAVAATDPAGRLLTIKAAADRTDDHVVIALSDNGNGMTPEVLERAFDPLFSHRPAGRGRGLGLPRVRRLATLNGGSVRLNSAAGRGTSAELRLPVAR